MGTTLGRFIFVSPFAFLLLFGELQQFYEPRGCGY
jgi:hypothetical protein